MALPLICACAVTAVFFLRDLADASVVSTLKARVEDLRDQLARR
jgi:hypothetical protein